jgi:hypothetical protein
MEDVNIRNYFLNMTANAQEIRIKNDKGICIKLKTFCTSKEIVIRVKTQPTELEKKSFTAI